jgi:hypothetical protein
MDLKTRLLDIQRAVRAGAVPLIIAALIGGPFLAVGIYEAVETHAKVGASVSVPGTVVGNVWTAFAEGGASWCPVVEFKTADGRVVTFTDPIGSFPPDYAAGDTVRIIYDPADERGARIATWKRLWLAATIIIVVGTIPLLIAVVFVLLGVQRTD